MSLLRLVSPFLFSAGLLAVLLAGVFLLTEKVVIYPHERSLPLLNLNRVEETGFKTLSKLPGLYPREAISPSEVTSCAMAAVGLLTCFLAARSMARQGSKHR